MMIKENKDVYKFHATMKRAMLWVSGNDRAWLRDFFKTFLDREADTITYSWPMFDEDDNEASFSMTLKLTDSNGNLNAEAMYRNAIDAFIGKAETFNRAADRPDTNPDAAWSLRYHADNFAVIADMFNDAYYFETGVSLVA
jgi:hypothetical protein